MLPRSALGSQRVMTDPAPADSISREKPYVKRNLAVNLKISQMVDLPNLLVLAPRRAPKIPYPPNARRAQKIERR